MIPLLNEPIEYIEVLQGTIAGVNFTGTTLSLWVKLKKFSNLSRDTDVLSLDLGNKYIYKDVLTSVGAFIFTGNAIDFQRLLGEEVLITYKLVKGLHNSYLNFNSIILLSQLQEFKYPNEAGGDGYES